MDDTTRGERPPSDGSKAVVQAGRLWSGGVATAVVAALVAMLGVLVLRDVFDVRLVRPVLLSSDLDLQWAFALGALVLAVLATALGHLLVLSTPRPRAFFSWIVGLSTATACASAFTVDGSTAGRLGTALIDLAVGVCIGSLLSAVLARTVRRGR